MKHFLNQMYHDQTANVPSYMVYRAVIAQLVRT